MTLTVREKEHWKERISRRIDLAIETLQAEHDPGFRKRITEAAELQAWESLGMADLHNDCRQISREIADLQRRREDLWARMLVAVKRIPLAQVGTQRCEPHEVRAAVASRSAVHERKLLRNCNLGKRILNLLEEKEELLDTVWLATSPAQIKELWSRFAELLDWQPTKLQKEALSIAPPSD